MCGEDQRQPGGGWGRGGYRWGDAGLNPPLEPVLGDQASILGLPDEPGSRNAESGTFNGFTEKLPLLPV